MNKSGFSLIELLIVLVIIGIIVGIAYPSYQSHVVSTRRMTAKVALQDLAVRLEQYYSDHHSYEGANVDNLGVRKVDFYKLEVSSATESEYIIKAIPLDIQEKADQLCGSLMLDAMGNQSITGTGKIPDCWQ